MKRIKELCDKLYHPENAYCRKQIGTWMLDAVPWAKARLDATDGKGNGVQNSEKTYRLLFVLNHLCPNLVHLKPIPVMSGSDSDSVQKYNAMRHEYDSENTHASIVDANGNTIQEGILYTDEEYDFLLCAAFPAMQASGDATALKFEHLSIPRSEAEKIVETYSAMLKPIEAAAEDKATQQVDVWARLGVSIKMTFGELNELVKADADKAGAMIITAIKDGRVRFDGDSYIPGTVFENINRENNTTYVEGDLELELDVLDGATLYI